MLPSVVEKFSFGLAAAMLFFQGRLSALVLGFGMVDLVLGCLFVVAFLTCPRASVSNSFNGEPRRRRIVSKTRAASKASRAPGRLRLAVKRVMGVRPSTHPSGTRLDELAKSRDIETTRVFSIGPTRANALTSITREIANESLRDHSASRRA
jgi:hypothetical protein